MGVKVKTKLEKQVMKKAVNEMNFRSLFQAGGFVRTTARREIRKRKGPSTAGTPVHTRGQLKASDAILFEVDEKFKDDVVVGPTSKAMDQVMRAHEFGETYKGQKFKKRAVMGPALEKSRNRLPRFWANKLRS